MGSHMAKRITMTKPSAPPTTTLAWEEVPEAETPTMAEAEIVVQKSRHVVRGQNSYQPKGYGNVGCYDENTSTTASRSTKRYGKDES